MKVILTIFSIILISIKSFAQNEKTFPIKNDSINLYAFIGKKISVEEFDPNKKTKEALLNPTKINDTIKIDYVMDNAFNAKYEVIKSVFNKIDSDTVSFVAYDHYGRPGFENYDVILIYVSYNKKDKRFFHQKYQFDPLKKSKNGNWNGLKGETIEELFEKRKNGVFTARGIF